MPCSTCDNMFLTKPCKHPTGELFYREPFKRDSDSEVFLKGLPGSMADHFTLQRLRNLYQILYKQCPCKECLVKSICSFTSPDCETYYSLITQANV